MTLTPPPCSSARPIESQVTLTSAERQQQQGDSSPNRHAKHESQRSRHDVLVMDTLDLHGLGVRVISSHETRGNGHGFSLTIDGELERRAYVGERSSLL